MADKVTAPIWKKDDVFNIRPDIIRMDALVVELPEKEKVIPLFWNYHDEKILGKVNNIRLEDDAILGDVEFLDDIRYERIDGVNTGIHSRSMLYEMLDRREIRLGGFYNHVEQKDRQVLKANLVGVSVIMEWDNPGAKIDG